MKRISDVVLATALLIALAPLIAATALGVRLALGSPVIFRQERAGRHGVPFTMYKFRSMLDGDGTDEERLTRVGRFIRSTSLDELPELVNVIRGDMSLVGPRPLHVHYLGLYTPTQMRRHEVRPGLTGLAQVSGRNLTSWERRLELDVEYVDTRTFATDIRILLATVRQVASRSGVSAENSATMEEFRGSDAVTGPSPIVQSDPRSS